jgi:ribosomal protein L3
MGKGRSHASQFPESRKADKRLAGLSAWTRNRVTWTRPQAGNLPLASPVGVRRFTVSSFGVCRVERLDVLVALSREVRKDVVLVRPVVVTHDHMEVDI